MKKLALIGVVLFAALFVLVFNIEKISSIKEEGNTSKEQSRNTIELKFAHHMPEGTVIDEAAHRYADEVRRKTNGKVNITIYPNQKLGNSHQMLELSRLGEIDILLTASAKISVASPSMQYADLPFLFPGREDAYALLDGKVGEMLFRDLNNIDLLGVAFWEGGFKNFTSNRALKKLEDFKDLKVRVMKSRIIMEQFHALGAKPITIDFHATKKALQDGVVDAQENPLSEIVGMEFYKVQSDMTLSGHSYLPYVLTFSKKTVSKLPLDIQNTLIKTAKEVTVWEREAIAKKEKALLAYLEKTGIHIHTFSPLQRQRLKDATAYIERSYEDIIGSHIISKTQEYFYKRSKKDDVAVIGIDADLSMGAKGGGLAIKRGVELAVEKINKKGGLLGKRVVIVAKDHQGISTQAAQNIKEFIEDKNTIALIGGKHSSIISSYMKDIQDNKLVYFSPWAAAASVTQNGYKENYIFRVSLNDKYAAGFLAQSALKKSPHPAIVVENSIWGKEALNNINLYLESKGLKRQNGIIINRGETHFEKVFQTVQNKYYDSIIMILNSQEGTRLVEYMGKNDIRFPVISHWGIVGDSFFKANQRYLKDMDLSFIQTLSLAKSGKKEAQELAKDYLRTYSVSSNEHINAITGVAQAYDCVMLLARAVEKCKSFDSQKIKASLENIDSYNGILKVYKRPFSKSNHDALNIGDFFMAKFDEEGNIISVKDKI